MSTQAYAALSNFGRNVEITIVVPEAGGSVAVGLPTEIVFSQQVVPENASPQIDGPTLSLRHDVAQSLYEALYRLYGPTSVPQDVSMREALAIERKRVDRLIEVALSE